MRRRFALTLMVAVCPFVAGACNGDESRETVPRNPNSTTTGVPQTSTSVNVPTSAASGTPGQGSQPAQPGGTAQPQTPGPAETSPPASG